MHSSVVVRLPLLTALTFPMTNQVRRMPFESLIAGILFQLGMDGAAVVAYMQKLISCYPVGDRKMAMASQAILEAPVLDRSFSSQVTDVMRIFRDDIDISIEKFKPTSKDQSIRGSHKKVPVAYFERVSVKAIYYIFHGDVDAVGDILRSVRVIGPKRGAGGAELDVENISFQEIPHHKWIGVVGVNDALIRPVPEQLRRELQQNLKCHQGAFETWYPPYHVVANREACFVPMHEGTELIMNHRQLQECVGW